MDLENAQQIFWTATSIIGIASVIAAYTPTPVDDKILVGARKILDLFAFNTKHAKNAEQVAAEKFRGKA